MKICHKRARVSKPVIRHGVLDSQTIKGLNISGIALVLGSRALYAVTCIKFGNH